MKNIKLIFVFVLTLFAASNAAFAQSRVGGRVVEIRDGKTVVIEMQNRGRIVAELQYIEVPEAGQPFHQISRDHLQTLVLDQKVEYRARGLRKTTTIGQLFLKGVDVSQQMIRDGAAWYAVMEKSGQDAAESEIYQSNETQAKNEKRGIWSIENLKPSWEIRAEAEANRQRQEKLAQEEFQKKYEETPKRRTVVARPPADNNFGMWADVSSYTAEKSAGVGGLEMKYDSVAKTGYVASTRAVQTLAAKKLNQTVDFRMAYVYRDAAQGRDSIYLIGILSEAEDWKFLKANNLTVIADDQKIVLGKATRLYRQTPGSAQELLLYKINRSAIAKISRAKKLEVNLGIYSGKLSDKLQNMLKNLLEAAD
jgi:endonuclease YncB( thermonuclease family)